MAAKDDWIAQRQAIYVAQGQSANQAFRQARKDWFAQSATTASPALSQYLLSKTTSEYWWAQKNLELCEKTLKVLNKLGWPDSVPSKTFKTESTAHFFGYASIYVNVSKQ